MSKAMKTESSPIDATTEIAPEKAIQEVESEVEGISNVRLRSGIKAGKKGLIDRPFDVHPFD
jgi:hypothetical protein